MYFIIKGEISVLFNNKIEILKLSKHNSHANLKVMILYIIYIIINML